MIVLTDNYDTGTSLIERTSIYGCSFFSSHIPLFAVYKGAESVFFKHDGKLNIIWHHKVAPGFIQFGNKYSDLYESFKRFLNPVKWKNKQNKYFVRKGMICTEDFQILVAVCINRDKLETIDKENPDFEDLAIIVNKSFYEDKHKLLFRRFQKDFLNVVDVDVITTKNPDKYCFNTPKFIPKFGNFDEMENYLDNINNELCLRKV